MATTTTALASLPSPIASSPEGGPARGAVVIPFPRTPPMTPAEFARRAAEVEARLLRAVQGLAEATRSQRDAVADYRRTLGLLRDRSGSLLRTMEPLPGALADLGSKVSEIGAQARRLERLMDAAIAGQAPDANLASEIRGDARR